ncbi:MAG: DUF4263 domain-containing protein [Prosthecobacter sp.]
MADKLQKLLDEKIGEREGLAPFVKKYPQVLKTALLRYEGGWVRGIAEFKFGNELQADFVFLTAFSGGFIIKFVELESSIDKILNLKGTMSAKFNHAYCQVQSWKEYVQHRAKGVDLGLELERQFREKEILELTRRGSNPLEHTTRYPLSNPDCTLVFQYAIVIGRRESLTTKEIARKGTLSDEQVEVVSWDRLLDAATEFRSNGEKMPAHELQKQSMHQKKFVLSPRLK